MSAFDLREQLEAINSLEGYEISNDHDITSMSRHEVDDIVEENAHAERFGKHGQLRANVPIAHDTEGLATNLPAALGLFVPDPVAHLERALEVLTREGDNLGDDELRD